MAADGEADTARSERDTACAGIKGGDLSTPSLPAFTVKTEAPAAATAPGPKFSGPFTDPGIGAAYCWVDKVRGTPGTTTEWANAITATYEDKRHSYANAPANLHFVDMDSPVHDRKPNPPALPDADSRRLNCRPQEKCAAKCSAQQGCESFATRTGGGVPHPVCILCAEKSGPDKYEPYHKGSGDWKLYTMTGP